MKRDEEKLKELRHRVFTEDDFINSRKHNDSIAEYQSKNKGASPDNVSAYFLCMTPEEVRQIYDSAVLKIRQFIKLEI